MTKQIVFKGEGEKEVRYNAVDYVMVSGMPITVDEDTAKGIVRNNEDVAYFEGVVEKKEAKEEKDEAPKAVSKSEARRQAVMKGEKIKK